MLKQLFFLAVCFAALQCKTQKKTEYYIPPDVAQENRVIFIERFQKGKVLFKINCSDCHGIYSKGRDSVPNFTKQQIDNYTALILAKPKDHAVIKKISQEQLDYILTFLRLRIKEG